MAIDYVKLAERSAELTYWDKVLQDAKSRLSQAEVDVSIAESELSIRKKAIDTLIEMGDE